MKTLKFSSKEEWLAARRGKITGSRLKDIVVKRGTGKKIGFYELIAERLGIAPDEENAMERGSRLESEAIEHFVKETDKKVDTSLVIWTRDDNDNIAISPDGFIGKKEAVEVKCLSSARHIEALITNQVPDEYQMQATQYFVVNDALKTLYFVFYDPRILSKPFFTIEVKREDKEEEITEYLEYQKKTLDEVDAIVNQLTF
jgi:putative phage-type endonuclease